MARKNTTTNTTPATVAAAGFNAKRSVDIMVPMGFVVQCDADLSVAEGTAASSQALKVAEDAMGFRFEEKVLEALRSVFGDRVSFFETAPAYMGDPKTGMMKKVRADKPVAPAIVPVEVAPKATPKNAEPAPAPVTPNYEEMTVGQLRAEAKKAGKKTGGTREVLLKRLAG